ncbi:hypothetical protein BJY00DRAFT_307677 [Aspergillus carlsbadensis]|nr:hypothetical protein BJY00DRAFT_307677 [Aspergillus carlsbadensis]
MEENHNIIRTIRPSYGLLDVAKAILLNDVAVLILALSKDLEEWMTDHQEQIMQHSRILEAHEALTRQAKQMAEKQKHLEFENDIYRKMFKPPKNPKDIAELRSAGENSSHTHREATPRPAPTPRVSGLQRAQNSGPSDRKRDTKFVAEARTDHGAHARAGFSRSESEDTTRSTGGGPGTQIATTAEVDPIPSSSRSRNPQQSGSPTRHRTQPPDVMSFTAPTGSRGGNRTFMYEFSETVPFRPNPLYPARGNARVQRPPPTRLVYPATDISTSKPNGATSSKIGLPLPMTLEELYSGTSKEVVLFRTDPGPEEPRRNQVILNIGVDAGMNAGQEIEATIEHPVFRRESANLFMVSVGVVDMLGPKSIKITTIDGQILVLRNVIFHPLGNRLLPE